MEARDIELMADLAPESSFVIHKGALLRNLHILKHVQDKANVEILLALKGYACHSTFHWIRPFISGVSASSPHEAQLGYEKLELPVHAYAPAYSQNDIQEIAPIASHIVFNSGSQLERFSPIIETDFPDVSIGARLNPEHSEAFTEIYDPSSASSRLGIKQEHWKDDFLNHLTGIHIHNLCENDSFALERTLDALKSRFGNILHKVNWINMGGGHLISSEKYDVEHLIQLLRQWKHDFGHRIFLEPGEAFGIGCGILKGTVTDIQPQDKDGVSNLITNVSATAHMPDTLEMPYRPQIYNSGFEGEKRYNYRIGGPTCLAGDQLGIYSFEDQLAVGHSIIFLDMAHYTMVKTTFFNGVRMPSIALFDDETGTLDVVREFGFQDYADKLS